MQIEIGELGKPTYWEKKHCKELNMTFINSQVDSEICFLNTL